MWETSPRALSVVLEKQGSLMLFTVHLIMSWSTKTLVKNCTVLVDSTPYPQWHKSHCALPLGRKKGAKLTPEEENILNKT